MSRASSYKINKDSGDSVFSGFDLFEVPPTNTSILQGEDEEYQPLSGGSEEGEVEWSVPGLDAVYVDLANSYIEFTVKVVKQDKTDLPANAGDVNVWCGDNFLHSLFSRGTFRLNNRDTEYVPDYAWRAWLENVLNFTKENKKGTLEATSGWQEDKVTLQDGDVENSGAAITARKQKIAGSSLLTFFARPRISFLAQHRLLYPGISFGLKLTRHPAKFSLMSADSQPEGGARVLITNSVYHVRRVRANNALFNAQVERLLQGTTLKYPLNRIKTQVKAVERGSVHKQIIIEQNTQRPNRVIVGLVKAAAVAGDFKLNPFKFSRSNLSRIELQLDGMGEGIVYSPADQPARPYCKLASMLDRNESGHPFGVTFDEWKNVNNLYAFDFSADLSRDAFHLYSEGTLTLKLQFSDPVADNLLVFIYQEHDDLVQIDLHKTIHMVSSVL